MAGKIITTNIASIGRIKADEIWLITRGGKKINLPEVKRVVELAPSEDLFTRYIAEWKGKPPDEWWPIYEKIFKAELQTAEKLNALRRLWKIVKSGKTVALVCFCKKNDYCHRRLEGEFLESHGLEVVEISDFGGNEKHVVGRLFDGLDVLEASNNMWCDFCGDGVKQVKVMVGKKTYHICKYCRALCSECVDV